MFDGDVPRCLGLVSVCWWLSYCYVASHCCGCCFQQCYEEILIVWLYDSVVEHCMCSATFHNELKACWLYCMLCVLPSICAAMHIPVSAPMAVKLMMLPAHHLLCSRWRRTESPVFVASGGCLTYPLLVHMQGTSSCMVSVWARVRASLVLLVVVELEGLLPFLLLVAPQHHLWCIQYSSLYVVVSSKFVDPVHSWSSVACLFVIQLSSILYHHLLVSPSLFVLLWAWWHLGHRLFVVECRGHVLAWHVLSSTNVLLWSNTVVSCWWYWHWMWHWSWSSCSCWIRRWLLWWSAACADVGLVAVGLSSWLLVVLALVVYCQGEVLLSWPWTMFFLCKVLLQGFSFVAWCQVFGMHLQCSHCCHRFFLQLLFCSFPALLLELDTVGLAQRGLCVVFFALWPNILGCWLSRGHFCSSRPPYLLVSRWLVWSLLLCLGSFDVLPVACWLECWQLHCHEVESITLNKCWVEFLCVCVWDCWCLVELYVEPLFCQCCYWQDGLCHFAHKEGNNYIVVACWRWSSGPMCTHTLVCFHLLLFSVVALVHVPSCAWVCWAQTMVGRHVFLLHCRSWYRLCSHPVGLTEALMPLVLMASCSPVLPQDVWPAIVVPALCGCWCCQRKLWCLLRLLVLLPSLFGHCYTSWHHSRCLGNTIVPCCHIAARTLYPTNCGLLFDSLWPSDLFGHICSILLQIATGFVPFPWLLAPLFFPCPLPVPFTGCHTCLPFTFPFASP